MVWARTLVLTGRTAIRSTKILKNNCSRNVQLLQCSLICQKRLFSSAAINAERLYTTKHEWVVVNGEVGTIGITHYAQEALGDVVYAQLPDIGQSVNRNEECGALESVKAASELYSPITGKVVEKNGSVEDTPALVNESCYDKGWLFKLKITNSKEISELMNAKQYEEFCTKD